MLIPLGFFGGAAGGDYELIQSISGNGSTGYISFDSIPQSYKHLQIKMIARASSGGSSIAFGIRLNNVAGAYDYWNHRVMTVGTDINNSNYTGSFLAFFGTDGGGSADRHTAAIHELPNYTATNFKSIKTHANNGTEERMGLYEGSLRDSNPITSVQIFTASGVFASGSRFSLYGMKG